MSEDNDNEEDKTEDPSQHRKDQARKKGQVAVSKDIVLIGGLVGIIICLLIAPYILNKCGSKLKNYFENPSRVNFSLFQELFLFPVILSACTILSCMLQTNFMISTEHLKPKFKNLSIKSGIKKLFSINNIVTSIKLIFKFLVIYFILQKFAWPIFLRLGEYSNFYYDFVNVIIYITLSFVFLSALDYIYEKYKFTKKIKMTKYEQKKEYKELEGNQEIKHRRSQIHRQMSRRSPIAAMDMATLLITNPTHYAVAISYKAGMRAPSIVAKGSDERAQELKLLAIDKGVPIFENPEIARTLFKLEVDSFIPEEMYRVVAQMIRFIHMKNSL
jgi:flagellar biosynthesis protein FlhB